MSIGPIPPASLAPPIPPLKPVEPPMTNEANLNLTGEAVRQIREMKDTQRRSRQGGIDISI
jgi:hypothetical protein